MDPQTTASNQTPTLRRARRIVMAAAAGVAIMGAAFGANVAVTAPAPVAVIDTGAMVNPALTPTVTVANGGQVGDPRAHGSLMLTTIAGPGAPAAGGAVSHYGCDNPAGGVDGACALDALNDALNRGVRVVSLSWSTNMDTVGAEYRAAFAAAVARANANGVIVAAAAYPGGPTFPADIPGVVSVGAVERDGYVAYPGDNAQLRLPTENTDGVDATGARIVRAGSSFATAEFSARAARIIGDDTAVPVAAVPAQVVAEMHTQAHPQGADRAGLDAGSLNAPSAARGATTRHARAVSARVAKQRAVRDLRRGTKLRAAWRRGRLIVTGRVPARAQMDVVWRGTQFACGVRRCSVRLIGTRTKTVRVRVSRGSATVVVRVVARGR